MKTIFQFLGAGAGAVAGWFSNTPLPFKFLVLLMTLDYLSGIAAALLGRSPKTPSGALSSKIGFIGLARKAMILSIVLLACVLDSIMGGTASTGAVILFYIVNESISILENAVLLGVPIPKKLTQMLDIAKKEG